jgi:hypothetical protein
MDASNKKNKELNLGKIDRALRILIGVAMVSQVAFSAPAWVGLVGLVLVLTGTMGFCPIYGAFGVRTCRAGG